IIFASALGQMIMMLATLFVACAALLILDICVYGNVSETLGCFWSFALTALTELLLYFSVGLFAGTVSEEYAPMTVLCVSFWLTRAAVRAMLSVKAVRVENSWIINYYTRKSRLAFYPLTPNGMWASFEQQRLMAFIVSLGVAFFIAALAVVALKYGRLERKKRGYHSSAVACAVKVSVMISVFFLATVFFNDNIVYVIRMFTELSVYPVLQVFEENAVLYYCVGSSLVAFLVTSMLTVNLREVVRDAALLTVYALLSAVAGKLIIAYCFW
ncbi:MAG: hypothetical protein IJY04_05605, partial [Clostridia bacterium]|nr:hypothetical protein [Clostridia bacterium]